MCILSARSKEHKVKVATRSPNPARHTPNARHRPRHTKPALSVNHRLHLHPISNVAYPCNTFTALKSADGMGQPRASRRRIVAGSSDDEQDETPALASVPENGDGDGGDDEVSKPATGKLKSIRRSSRQQPTPASSLNNVGSQKSSGQAKAKAPESKTQTSPGKAKAPKTKPKPTVQDEPKTKAKPIYSFFNAATQRQQSSQRSASPMSTPAPPNQTETIDSDDDNASSVALSKGSSVAMAMRKRKTQHAQGQEDVGLLPPPTQKFRKTSDGGRAPSLSVVNEDKRPWVVQFGPSNLDQLAVHKRKVGDVRNWLEAAYNGKRQKVLLLKGAAGTAKTTTVELLAKDMGIQITEWKNPAGSDLTSEESMSASLQFEDFVGRAGRSGGLTLAVSGQNGEVHDGRPADVARASEGRQLLLIEEFPNTFSRTSPVLQSFRSAISQYLASPPVLHGTPTPIVLVISETLLSTSTAAADSFTAHRLLGPELLNNPWLDTIEFNAIAPTILTKALENVVVKEARRSGRRKTPGPLVLKRIAETGDIRSAVSSLEFLCLRGDDGDTWSSKVTFTKTKKSKAESSLTKAEGEALKLISNRENSLGIFHSVGKIVYNKRQEPERGTVLAHPPPWLPQHRRNKVPETDVDRLIDELGTDATTYVAALHENYVLSCCCTSLEDSLDSISGCIDSISDADLLSLDRFSFGTRAFQGSATDTLRQDEMSFQAAVRGVLFNLPCPVHRGTPANGKKGDSHHMFYPTSLKIWRKKEEINDMLDLLTAKLQNGALNSSAQTQPTSGASGVASWKRESSDTLSAPAAIASAKAEFLTERLPYMARILESKSSKIKPPPSQSQSQLSQILSVTRIRESSNIATDNDDDDDENPAEQEARSLSGESWATDKPDAEASSDRLRGTKAKRKLPGSVGTTRGMTEGGGLGIPVESEIERLVLEEDDIVDD
jgi:cell cycle checkpoint protein